jgi:hypothetical protein
MPKEHWKDLFLEYAYVLCNPSTGFPRVYYKDTVGYSKI